MNTFLRKRIPYKKTIGSYKIRVEYLNSRWYGWVTGPVGYPNSVHDVIFAVNESHFQAALRKCLDFVYQRANQHGNFRAEHA